MANNQNKSGCINFIFLLVFAPLILFAVGKGCIVPTGSKETVKCSACYGTGYEKRPIPSDGKIPLKPYPKK